MDEFDYGQLWIEEVIDCGKRTLIDGKDLSSLKIITPRIKFLMDRTITCNCYNEDSKYRAAIREFDRMKLKDYD